MARVTCKLRGVRIAFAHLKAGNLDKFGHYSVTVMVPKNSPAHAELKKRLAEAWEAGTDSIGKQTFEQNPSELRIQKMACLKVGGGLDDAGKPLPSWMDDFVCFNVQSTTPVPVCDGNFEEIDPGDSCLYDGQVCNVSFDLVPFNNAEKRKSGLSRYLRNVLVVGGGDTICTRAGGFTNAIDEWAE